MSLNKEFFANNRRKTAEAMKDFSMAVVFNFGYRQRSEDDGYDYTPNRNYYYLTGLKNINGIFLMTKIAGNVKEYVFTERPSYRGIMYKGPFPTQEQYKEETGIENVLYFDEFDATVGSIMAKTPVSYVYCDLKKFAFDDTLSRTHVFLKRMRENYPDAKAENLRPIVCNLRRVKTEEEVALVKRAAQMTKEAVDDLAGHIAPGVWTYSLYAQFNYYLGYHYGEPHAFQSVITTGQDIMALHPFEKFAEMQDGDLVLVDLGAECELYSVDICRMFPVNGKFTEQQKYFYEAVIAAEEFVASHLKPGFDMSMIPALADKVLIDYLRKAGLIEKDEEVRKYLDHGIYHFIGMDNHDAGDDCVLEPGMILSLEPSLYLPELNIGVRAEDNYLITEDGCVCLTANLPKYPEDIEKLMVISKDM